MSAAIEAVDSDLTQDGTELTFVVTTDVVVAKGFEAGAGAGAGAGAAALTTEKTSKAGNGAGEGAGNGETDGPAAAKEATNDCVCVMKLSNGAFGQNEPNSSATVSV
jgi:hypothetical protein